MEIDLPAAMRGRTDEELLAIVGPDHHQFTNEALAAARAELDARRISWAEPNSSDSPAPGAARDNLGMTAVGVLLLIIVGASLFWRGLSLPALALFIPALALLTRAMRSTPS